MGLSERLGNLEKAAENKEIRELTVEMCNKIIIEIVNLFVQVNQITDPEERKRLFAEGADRIAEDNLPAALLGH